MSLPSSFNVMTFGATGNGVALDTVAINAALRAAHQAGGGVVTFPRGSYLSFSIQLRDNVTLHLADGATIVAATPSASVGAYDHPSFNRWGDELQYQDFGHSHWRNSLIWGENLTNIAITGPGRIDGQGLDSHLNYGPDDDEIGPNGTTLAQSPREAESLIPRHLLGRGNKVIALRECHHVTLRDFSIFRGGHFALLATGVNHLTIDRLLIDTNRDGLDLDGCQHVKITNCTVNSPADDAIVLKSSYALGKLQPCEDIAIRHCKVSGFDVGTVLDGSRGRATTHAPDRDGPTGRIKIGTESNGDFRRITIADCTFERSRGLALETVDGATIEDIEISRIKMKEVTNSPLFLRLGNRGRGPTNLPVGRLRRVRVSEVEATGVDGRFPIIIAGIPDHLIEDITLEDFRIFTAGGILTSDVEAQSDRHVNAFFLGGEKTGVTGPRSATPAAVPLRTAAYPEPSMFGLLPASALYLRYIRGLNLVNVHITFESPDQRPPVIQDHVSGLHLDSSNLYLTS